MGELFDCHWCRETHPKSLWHHTTAGRACCESCYTDRDSNYKRVYGESASARLEAMEVKRAQGRPVRVRPKLSEIEGKDQEQ